MLSVFEPCDYLPFRLRAGAVDRIKTVDFEHLWRINQNGFREPDRPLSKAPGEVRILALGDSFTAGHGVEEADTWPRVLERTLQTDQPSARVINAGYAGGYAPDCYYAYLHRNLDQLAPDVVVIALFAGNDSYEAMNHFEAERDGHGLPTRVLSLNCWVDDAGRRRLAPGNRPLAYQYPLLQNSHLWVLATQALSAAPTMNREFHSPHRRVYAEAMEQAYRRSVESLKGIGRLTAERKIGLVVAIIPTCGQLDPSIGDWTLQGDDLDLEIPQRRWLNDLRNDVTMLDLRPALRDEGSRHDNGAWSLYHPNDRHFTALGQQVTALRIGELLREIGLCRLDR